MYFRAPILGEFDVRVEEHVFLLNTTEIALVRVEQIAPGVRRRTGLPFIEHLP